VSHAGRGHSYLRPSGSKIKMAFLSSTEDRKELEDKNMRFIFDLSSLAVGFLIKIEDKSRKSVLSSAFYLR
jgi:hypothetical protein